jgi:myo-inositol 2-dehydrogenase/D-chiro-inositol 1-dehydrogenase
MSTPINVAVIGTGRIGRMHAGNLATNVPGVRVIALSDIVQKSVDDCAAEIGVKDAYTDYQSVLERKDVEAVIICSSTDTHSKIITEAAQAGKQIFCEKPIDFDLGRIDSALKAVTTAGVKLQIGFNRRFDPSMRRVWQAARDGAVGDIHVVRITSRDPGPPPIEYIKVSGGIFLDMTIHDFDMARYLSGSEVTEVYADGAVLVDRKIGEAGDIDTAIITLRFENGAIGSIDNSRKAVYGYDQRVEVFGSAGMADAANGFPNTVRVSGAKAVTTDLPLNFFIERYTESYLAEMREFVKAIVEGSETPVTGADGRAPVVIGKTALRSLEEHRPVKTSEIDKD